jgi:hypothetical protein
VSSGRGGREKRASSPFYREREGRGRGGRRSIKEAITASVSNKSNGGREKRKSSRSINERDEWTTSALCHGASVPGVRSRRSVEASRRGECRARGRGRVWAQAQVCAGRGVALGTAASVPGGWRVGCRRGRVLVCGSRAMQSGRSVTASRARAWRR